MSRDPRLATYAPTTDLAFQAFGRRPLREELSVHAQITQPAPAPAPGKTRPWRADAACVGIDLAVFFEQPALGLPWCRRCPVAEVCLWTAMDVEATEDYRFGVYGGLGPVERARLAEDLDPDAIAVRSDAARAAWVASGDQAA